MSENEKKVPKRRFKEFENAGHWEQRKVKEVCSISTGKSNTQDRIDDGIYPFYVRSPIIEHSNRYLYDEEAVLTVGDGVGTGKVFHYVKGKYDLHQRVYRMFDFSKGTSGKYFYYYFSNHFYNRVMSMTAKTSVDSVRFEMISEMDIMLPSEKEQIEIKDFFDNLNHLIAIHQRKLDKMKALKEAYLTEIFPAEGERKPKLRFAGFIDDWEKCELNTLADRYDNLRVPITASDRVAGNTPYYGANGIQDYVEGFTHDGEYILVAEDGANDLKNYPVNYVNGRIWVNNHAHVLQAKQNIADNKFLKYAISRTNIETFLVGGGRAKLNADTMMKICIKVPKNILEQVQIGVFFTNLDNIITLHQRKLEKLENIKKAYLNEMFI